MLAGCGAGLSSASEAADRGATEESTTRAESSPDGSTRTSEDPAAADRSTEDGVDDEAALGIGDDYFPDSGNPGYDVASYDLVLDMDDDLVSFEAVATIALRTTEDLDELRFDLDGLTVTKATIDGKKVEQRRAGLDLVLTPEAPLPADEPVVVIVDYEGTPEPRGSGMLGEVGWIGEPNVGSYVASEPDGASNWFPANDHPSDKATFKFEITTPEGVEAVANGTRTGVAGGCRPRSARSRGPAAAARPAHGAGTHRPPGPGQRRWSGADHRGTHSAVARARPAASLDATPR